MIFAFDSKKSLLDFTAVKAFQFEQSYHGCAQSGLAALMEAFPEIYSPEAFRAASGLAGGVGLSIEGSCGALTGGAMAISLLFGRKLEAFDDQEGRRFTAYRLAKQLQDRFMSVYGTSICSGIQKKVLGRPYSLYIKDEFNEFVEKGGHSDKCPQVVSRAARWAAEIMLDELEASGMELEFRPPAESL